MPQIILDSESRRQHAIKVLSLLPIDKPKCVTVEDWHPKRSNVANARLWALHTLAANHTGYSPEDMHEFCLCKHFGFQEKEVTDPLTGEITVKRIPNKRSSARNTKEFAEFMEASEAWYISEFGVFLE
jgi:hypothetical protein